jgi:hypothetical protein
MITPPSPPQFRFSCAHLLTLLGTVLAAALPGAAFGQNLKSNDTGGYEVIANASGFACDIPGAPDASRNIREIAIDELNIDVRELTTGLDVGSRLYGPGKAHWGSAKFTSACTLGGSKELEAWFQEAKAKNIRKNITVTLFKSDKTPGRSYTLFDCFPTDWSSVNPESDATGTAVSTETLTVKIGRIEFKTLVAPPSPPRGPGTTRAEATVSDKFAQVRGFKVEISGSSGKEVDTAWESVSGGDMAFSLTRTPARGIGSDKFSTFSPGHKTVSEITLRGAMTDGRKNLCAWINDTVAGRRWKQMLTITELLSVDGGVKDGKSYLYHDCFPIRYVFPRMSVTNTTGNVQEQVVFHAARAERALPPFSVGRLTIPLAPLASTNALRASVEDMAMDVNLVPTTGDARNPSARILLPAGSGDEMRQWLEGTAQGTEAPRTIIIDLFNQGRFTGRRLLLWDCLPQGLTTVPTTTGNTMEEITVKPIRVELK